MYLEEHIARLQLIRTPKIGRVTFFNFLKLFGTAEKTIKELPEYLRKHGKENKYRIVSRMEILNFIQECEKHQIKILFFDDMDFPKNFLTSLDYPPILYCKGNIKLLNKNILAIVGSRIASLQGISLTKKIIRELRDFVIVSGLAKGIDKVAHEASLLNGTIAVLGSGVNIVYPLENQNLYDQIIQNNGLIISELGLNEEPKAAFFSYRNRIISGISNGVLVMEASLDSGSLVTAKYAAEQGKTVYAVPGHPYDLKSVGTNYLIKNGAVLVRNSEDILDEFLQYSIKSEQVDLFSSKISENNVEEVKEYLLNYLTISPISIYDIIDNSKYSIYELYPAFFELEMEDLIIIDRNFVMKIKD